MWYNPIMIWLLKSPLHGLISKGIALITYTGRKSGRSISIPTNYLRDDHTLWIVSWRDRTWWRNLRGGAKVRVLLAGQGVEGSGLVVEDHNAVAQSLCAYYQKVPPDAKYVGIGLDSDGQPLPADCDRAAVKMVMIRIDLETLG